MALARRHHPGKSLYTRKHGHHKHHKGKSKIHGKYYSNTWAVRFHPPHRGIADRIAKKHGFEVLRQVGNIFQLHISLKYLII